MTTPISAAATSPPNRRDIHAGTRTCVGCGQRVPLEERHGLLRLALVEGADGWEAHADLRRSSFGRGAWLHARHGCLEGAVQRGLARSVKGRVRATAAGLAEEVVAQAERRVVSLVASAKRAQALTVGADATVEALSSGRASLVVVAVDARAGAARDEVVQAISEGKAVAYGDKAKWGEVMNRSEVAVMAVLDAGIAGAVQEAISLVGTFGTLEEKKARLAVGGDWSPKDRGVKES